MSFWRDLDAALDEGSNNRMKKEELYAAMTLTSFCLCVPRSRTFNGTRIALVMEKVLYKSDLDKNHNRLSFGVNMVKDHEFLRTLEVVEKVKEGLEVTVIQPCLDITPNVQLRKRSKNEGRYFEFVLTGNWFQIAQNENNGLQKNKLVRLWGFWMGTDLWFALVKP